MHHPLLQTPSLILAKNGYKLNYPNTIANNNMPIPQFSNYQTNLPLKFYPQFSYYTDGSFMNPKEIIHWEWRREKA